MLGLHIHRKIQDRKIGELTNQFGYIGFDPIPKGTPVYELEGGRCYFEMTETATKKIHRQYFRIETIEQAIKKIT